MRTMIRIGDALRIVGACNEAKQWVASRTVERVEEHWVACERGDRLLWIAMQSDVDRRLVVRAACAVARESLVYVPAGELRPLRAVRTAEAWCRGEAHLDEVRAAVYHARAALVDAATRDDARVELGVRASARAYTACDAAVRAANSVLVVPDTCAANRVSHVAILVASAEASPWTVSADADAALRASLARSAEIVRAIIPWREVDRALYLAAGGVL